MKYYNNEIDEVIKFLNTSPNGLNSEDVLKRRNTYGKNQLNKGKKDSLIIIFLDQFKDFLVIILLIASVISAFLRDYESSIVIFVVTILNAVLGTVQHLKAEKSLESLKSLSAPNAKVIRDGIKIEIPSEEVVVGDILSLEAGDFICADGRILNNYSIQVNESSLTGESESVLKSAERIDREEIPTADKKNMVFSGSLVTYGRADVIVTAVGMQTEIGKIAYLLENAKEKKTPLQISLDNFGKKLALIILFFCAIIFVLNVSRGYDYVQSFMFAVALAVAAIPEALSSIVTIVLAIGTQKMAKENAIVKKLKAVEGLGCVSVICSDKTGTLTQNKMVSTKVYVDSKILDIDKLDMSNPIQKHLIEMSILCSDAVVNEDQLVGDPTEIALVNMGKEHDINETSLREKYNRVSELPFDSDRKLMSTLNLINDEYIMITKGALDVLLNKIDEIRYGNNIRKITDQDIKEIETVNKKLSMDGLRILSIAYKKLDKNKDLILDDENELIFLGLVAIIDPPRDEVSEAVKQCIAAGIKPIMITGDHAITAAAIAKKIGILASNGQVIDGTQLNRMSDEELRNNIENISVYARVSPEHKIRIVNAWQDKDTIVAMTGDGVNDAPALKQANIGISMGKVGTEVAKEASSMVLADDNFATIVKAISNGRSIYTNIKNSIQFLLSGNMAGILTVLYTSIAHLPLPFTPVQLLFINLLTDSMPAIALGFEPYRKDVMNDRPRNVKRSILSKNFLSRVSFEGTVIAIPTILAFNYGLNKGGPALASTMAFSTLSLARLIHGFNCRAKRPLYKIGFFTNKYIWYSLFIGSTLLGLVLTIKPLQKIFNVDHLVINELHMIVLFATIPLIIIQIVKTIKMIKR